MRRSRLGYITQRQGTDSRGRTRTATALTLFHMCYLNLSRASGSNSLLASTYIVGVVRVGNTPRCSSQDILVALSEAVSVVGLMISNDLPTTDGSLTPNWHRGMDVLVACFMPDPSSLKACTYFDGSGDKDRCSAAFGPDSTLYRVGATTSVDFPCVNNTGSNHLSGPEGLLVTRLPAGVKG